MGFQGAGLRLVNYPYIWLSLLYQQRAFWCQRLRGVNDENIKKNNTIFIRKTLLHEQEQRKTIGKVRNPLPVATNITDNQMSNVRKFLKIDKVNNL